MIKKIIFFCMMILPVFAFSQDKKSTKQLEEQVRIAKEQQAAAQNKVLPAATEGARLISFQLLTADSTSFTERDLPSGKPVLLVLFNPMCDHCQKAASTLKENIDQFKNVTILFVCGMNLQSELKNFIKTVGVEEYKNFIVCAAPEEFTKQLFESKGIPQMMAYNKEQILQKTFYETINIESVLNYLIK